MDLTYNIPDEPVSLDTAAFALHSMHLAACLSAFFFNVLLLYLLAKYMVFHHHMKIIMINLTLTVIAAIFYLLIRSALGIWQIYRRNQLEPLILNTETANIDQSECAFSESVPQSLCVLFFLFPMVLVTERAYATRKFWEYENENVPGLIGITCAILWIPTILDNLSFFWHFSTPTSLEYCQYSMLHKTILQRNIWFIIVSVFCLIFAILFKFLEVSNKQTEIDYVANHYSTISIRFQIRENIKTCRFAVSLNFLFCVSFFVFFLFDQSIGTESYQKAAAKREYLFLVFPIFALIYAIHFITSHSQLFDKAKKTLKHLTSIQSFGESEKMLP